MPERILSPKAGNTHSSRGLSLVLLAVAASAGAFARTALGPLQESMRGALSLTDNQIAVLQGPALALPVVLAAVPLGMLIDRRSRARLLCAFAICDVVGSWGTALAPNFTVLLIVRAVVGLTATATQTAAFSVLSDLYKPDQRGRATMAVTVGQYIGLSAAFALGGVLLNRFCCTGDSWRWSMLVLSVPLLLAVVATAILREPPRIDVTVQNPTLREVWDELIQYRSVILPLMLGLVAAEMAIDGALVWAAPSLARTFKLAPERIGAIMGTGFLLSGLLGPVAGGMLADFCQRSGGARRTMAALGCLALATVPAALFAVGPNGICASVLLVIYMTAVGAMLVAGTTLFTIVVPNEIRGICMAVLGAVTTLFGMGVAPVAVSLLSGALGGSAMLDRALALMGIISCLLGAAAFFLGRRYLATRRDREQEHPVLIA
jgi:MFS family permease